MGDRLAFERHVLDNGLTVYAKPTDVPFAMVRIVTPFGHLHCYGDVPYGAAHFLEHLACARSAAHPERDALPKLITSKGGYFNAGTGALETEFAADVPASVFEDCFPGFVSTVFEPLLEGRMVDEERGIITTERQTKSEWYPFAGRLGWYCENEWRTGGSLAARRRYGSDDDLLRIDDTVLTFAHRAYRDPRTYILIGGTFDMSFVKRVLSKYGTRPFQRPPQETKQVWKRREYHERPFAAERCYTYHLGGIAPAGDPYVTAGLRLMGNVLADTQHGALYTWLRREKNWAYSIDYDVVEGRVGGSSTWTLAIALTTLEQAREVRSEIRARIENALQDHDLIRSVVERIQLGSVFRYQTLGEIFHVADRSMWNIGRIITEREIGEILRHAGTADFLRAVYHHYFREEGTGEFLSTPRQA